MMGFLGHGMNGKRVDDASELREYLERHYPSLYEKLMVEVDVSKLPNLQELIERYNGDVGKIIKYLEWLVYGKGIERFFEDSELKTEYTERVKEYTPLYDVEFKSITELIEILYDLGVEDYRASELFIDILMRLRYYNYEAYGGTHFVALRCTRFNQHVVYRPLVDSRCGLKKMMWANYKANEYYDKFYTISERIKPVNGGRADYLIFMVFTLPKHRWDNVNERNFRRVVRETLREYFDGDVFGIMNFHVWHSQNPLMGRFPHCHVVVLNLIRGRDGNYYRVKPMVDVNRLRRIYGKRIQYDNPVVHVQYVSLRVREKCVHHLRYNMRKPLIDLERFFLDLENVRELVNVDLIVRKRGRWILELLNYKNRTIPIGNLMSKFKQFFGDMFSGKSRCPVCGADLKFWKIVRRDELSGKEVIVIRKDGMYKKVL